MVKMISDSTDAALLRCSLKKVFLKISLNSQIKTCVEPLFNNVASLRLAALLKKTLAQMFSIEHLLTPLFNDNIDF